jgi:membrane protein DedA with SNARE-associated domain
MPRLAGTVMVGRRVYGQLRPAGIGQKGRLDTGTACVRHEPPMESPFYVDQVIAFVRDHAAWAPPVVFALAFGESLAFISLLIPAWGALVAIGALIGPSGINFWPVWIAGSLGAAFGDWLSYWIGLKLEHSAAHIWPLSRHPDLIPRGEVFMKKWGIPGIFIGRFFGPLRAVVPLIAGIFEMPFWRFQIANFSSALVWAATLLTIGDVIAVTLKYFFG